MIRHVRWLRIERWEGVTHVSGDTCLCCERKAGVSAPIVLTGSLGVACHRPVGYKDISQDPKNPSNKLGLGKWCRKVDARK